MKKLLRALFVSFIFISSFTACSSGGGGGQPANTELSSIPVNLSLISTGYISTIVGTNAYTVVVIDATRTPLISYGMFLPNGLLAPSFPATAHLSTMNALANVPNRPFWLLDTQIMISESSLFNFGFATQDSLGRYVYGNTSLEAESAAAVLITPTIANTSTGKISTNTLYAIFESFSDTETNSQFYSINLDGFGSTKPFAVVARTNPVGDVVTLEFQQFVNLAESPGIYFASESPFSQCNGAVPGAGGEISAIQPFVNNNVPFVITATNEGALCLYDVTNDGWLSLTQQLQSYGYVVGSEIASLQAINYNGINYIYFTNFSESSTIPYGIWRAKLSSTNQITELINLFDTTKFSNAPMMSSLTLLSLFVDKFNNTYIGTSDSTDSLSKVYILKPGSTAWQAVTLSSTELKSVTAISLAVDGKTPVVGTNFVDEGTNEILTNAYYISGLNN